MSALHSAGENIMPGVYMDYESEITQDFDPSKFGTTDSVVVIGTAFSGKPGQLVKIYNSDMANYIYGSSYDASSRKTATLTAGIRDAYDRGCRTIYAMRVGGQDIYKDYQFCDEFNNEYRLRLVSMYPSNIMKECYVLLDLTDGAESITFYKPASKATIKEKKSGLVESANSIMKTTILLNEDNGLSKNDPLVEMINLFNNHVYNNVLRLEIVNKQGVVVTNIPEVQAIAIGSCYAGLYTIGRNVSTCASYTTISSNVIIYDDDYKPYDTYAGTTFKTLEFNSDVTTSYPIYFSSTSFTKMQEVLENVSVSTINAWDFLENNGAVNKAFQKDKIDYEETDISKFEMYKALGEGFAITAKATQRGKKANGKDRLPRVTEAPATDPNRIVGIKDGIYNILQDAEIMYRVVTCANADDKIDGKLPKADDFKVSQAQSFYLLGQNGEVEDYKDALVVGMPNIEADDFTAPKKYAFRFNQVDDDKVEFDNLEEVLTNTICNVIAGVDMDSSQGDKTKIDALVRTIDGDVLTAGSKVMVFNNSTRTEGQIVRYIDEKHISILAVDGMQGQHYVVDGIVYVGEINPSSGECVFKPVTLTPNTPNGSGGFVRADGVTPAYAEYEYMDKDYLLIEASDTVYVASVDQTSSTLKVNPLGSLQTMLGDNSDVTLIYAEDSAIGINNVVITTAGMSDMTLTEFVALLNDDVTLGKMFTFTLTSEGKKQGDMYLEELTDSVGLVKDNAFFSDSTTGTIYSTGINKIITYDYNKYIPYRTTDNFARQLAQHCAYTTLRTKNTHGIIGMTPVSDYSSAKKLAAKADEAIDNNFNLYAKTYAGKNMLDSSNLPYGIGRYISITMFQYSVIANDSDGYVTKSNGAAGYAGMVSTLPITHSTTLQPINLVQGADFTFSRVYQEALVGKGFVVLKNSETKGLVIADGVTMDASTNYTKRLLASRIMDKIGDALRATCEPFIGMINNMQNRNALDTAIDSTMTQLKDDGLIWSYEYNIKNLNTYTSDSYLDINYTVFPINEIKEINNFISITRNAS